MANVNDVDAVDDADAIADTCGVANGDGVTGRRVDNDNFHELRRILHDRFLTSFGILVLRSPSKYTYLHFPPYCS